MIDRATKWPEAFPIRNIDTETITKTFLSTWVCRFGSPKHLISDQGRQFEAGLFKDIVKRLGTTHIQTSAYHPQANGAIERFHRTLKTSMRILAEKTNSWIDVLPFVLLGWRNTPCSSTNTSPTQALFGHSTRFIAELIDQNAPPSESDIQKARLHFESIDDDYYCKAYNNFKPHLPKSLYDAKYLWLKNQHTSGLAPSFTGPFKIVQIFSRNAKILKDNKEIVVHLSNTKPAFFIDDDGSIEKSITNTPSSQHDNLSILTDILATPIKTPATITYTFLTQQNNTDTHTTQQSNNENTEHTNHTTNNATTSEQTQFGKYTRVHYPKGITRLSSR